MQLNQLALGTKLNIEILIVLTMLTSDAIKGGNITISAFGTFDSLNPFLLKSLPPAQVNNLMFDTLMTRSLDEPSSSYALLAKSYETCRRSAFCKVLYR